MTSVRPTIIQAAITGSITTREQHPQLPVTVEENIQAAVDSWRAGASIIALHAREDDGTPTQRFERYREIVEGIRATGCDAILNVSTGSANGQSTGSERYDCLDLKTEMATFDSGSINMGDRVFDNSVPFLRDLAKALRRNGVRPEIECFEAGHITTALMLRDEGLLTDPLHFQFVVGIPGAAPATVAQVMHMRSMIPPDATWSVCAIGRHQLRLNMLCFIEGGHLRTGLEDNIYYRKGELASNPQLVERLVRLADELSVPIASPAEARKVLSLPA